MAGALERARPGPLRRRRRRRPRRPDRHHRPRRRRRERRRRARRRGCRRAPVARAAASPGVARAVGDVTFPAGAWDAQDGRCTAPARSDCAATAGSSAALTPYGCAPGTRPPVRTTSSPTRASACASAARCGSSRPPARRTYRVSGVAAGRPAAIAARPRCSSPPARRAGAVRHAGPRQRDRRLRRAAARRPASCATRLRERMGAGVDVLDADHAADADAGDPQRRRPRRASSPSSARWAASPAPSRCSSWPARSRSRSPSAGARPPCCARSAPRRARSAG